MAARRVSSETRARVSCEAAGGIRPPEDRAALRTKARARRTAPVAMPHQAELQKRCA